MSKMQRVGLYMLAGMALFGALCLGNISPRMFGKGPIVEITAPAQPAVEEKICPSGWTPTSARDADVHVLTCSRLGWTVWLNPDYTFNYAWPGTGDWIFNKKLVPGWPSD